MRDEQLASLGASLRNHGRESDGDEWQEHKRLGYNYRLSEIACAIGVVQLERLNGLMGRRARVASWYSARLAGVDAIELPAERDDIEMSWFVYVVRLAAECSREDRDRVISGLRARGIGCRNYFPPIHLQPQYREELGYRPGQFPVTESAAERTIALPFYSALSEDEVQDITEAFRELL